MRFILALIPPQQILSSYIQAAQMLFSSIHEGYLLSDNSLPHVTLCHFAADTKEEAKIIWKQVEKLNIRP